jgi:RNA-directed DNA polymerase
MVMKPIVSVREFAHCVKTPVDRLYAIAAIPADYYREWPQRDKKNPAKIRIIREPVPELKAIQRRVAKHVLGPLGLSDVAHGGVRGRSPRSNAALHCGQGCVITLDVRNFFDSARHHVINRMLRVEYGFGRDVAYLITRLCTLHAALPQGAPSSTPLANLLLELSVDDPLTEAARRINIVNTRFVDDVALSGGDPRSLINTTARLLSRRGLRVWRKKAKFQSKSKLRIMPRHKPQMVTGLLVNSLTGPTVSRQKRDAIRAAIYQLREITDKTARDREIRSVRGRIEHVRQFNRGHAARLEQYLDDTRSLHL